MTTRRVFTPDATLDHIINEVGGTIVRDVRDRKTWITVTLQGRTYESSSNTILLTKIIAQLLREVNGL